MNKNIYVDAFVLSVKKDKLKEYKKMATMMAEICKKHGALSYVEAMEDDVVASKWPHKEFRKIAQTKADEVVFFSFITYPDKKTRTKANKLVDAEMKKIDWQKEMKTKVMPFDMKRMAYGGFKSLVSF